MSGARWSNRPAANPRPEGPVWSASFELLPASIRTVRNRRPRTISCSSFQVAPSGVRVTVQRACRGGKMEYGIPESPAQQQRRGITMKSDAFRVAIVTGGGRGLGRAMVLGLLQNDFAVAAGDRRAAPR